MPFVCIFHRKKNMTVAFPWIFAQLWSPSSVSQNLGWMWCHLWVMAAQHLPQQLGTCFTVVDTVVFAWRSLAQIMLNCCPQQHFVLIVNGGLIILASWMDCFNFILWKSFQMRELVGIPLLRDVLYYLWNYVLLLCRYLCWDGSGPFTTAVSETSLNSPLQVVSVWF